MSKEFLTPRRLTVPKGSCSIRVISKIISEEGDNIIFCLTRDSFLDTFLTLNQDKIVSYNSVDSNEIVEIQYIKSNGSVKFSVNETHDLFTLLFSDIKVLNYECPENPTRVYIIANEPSVF